MPTVEKELLDDCQAKLTVTVEPERVQIEKKKAARKIAGKVNIPGFRKGKAPYHIIVQHFGEGAIYEEMLEPLGQAVYQEALDQAEIDPYAPGSLENVEFEPMVLEFLVPLPPEIDLGDYREVRVDFEAEEVEDSDVDDTLRQLREEQADLETVERAVALEDVARLGIRGTFVSQEADDDDDEDEDDDLFIDEQDVKVLVTEDATYPVPGFPEKVVGMSAGDEREFDVTIAEDDEDIVEDLRGETIHFEVKCIEVQSRDLPELDDEFAKKVGEFESLDELRKEIRSDLERMVEQRVEEIYLGQVFDKLLDGVVTVKYPEVMLDHELDHELERFDQQLRRSSGLTLEDYYRVTDKSEEDLREEFRESVEKRLMRSLILGKLVEVEQLKAAEAEINDEIETSLLSYGSQAPVIRELMSTPLARQSVEERLLTDKSIKRLILIAQGEAPEIGAEEEPEAVEEPVDESQTEEPTDNDESESVEEPQADPVEENVEETESASDEK